VKTATVAELAALVGGETAGAGEVAVTGLADLAGAGAQEISFLVDPRRAAELAGSRAAAFIVPAKLPTVAENRPLIRVADPYLAVAKIHNFFLTQPFAAAGAHPSAVIGADCVIPAEVSIGPLAVLGNGVRLGERVSIGAGTVIGNGVEIGADTLIYPNVTIYDQSVIGCRVTIHSGSVIGSDGFGYAFDPVAGRHLKRPHVGRVRIDDEVEIGANCCIDRGTFGETVIRAGAKLDNLVQLGHNVEIGENALLVAQAGIAGSTRIGRSAVLGGQVGVSGHLKIGDRVMIAAKSGVHNNQEDGAVVAGIPAIPHRQWLRVSAAIARLPEMVKELRSVKKRSGENE